MTARTGLFALMIGCFCLVGCSFEPAATGPEKTDNIDLDSANIEKANIELDMGAGQMTIGGGASKLLDGTFTYNVDSWKPIVTDSTNGSHATVTIKQPNGSRSGGRTKYSWDLNLNDHVLTDLTINCGAGQARLNLGFFGVAQFGSEHGRRPSATRFERRTKHDYDVKIEGGVGQADVRLPKNVGIWAAAHGGIG